jgi:molybdopterin-containing oxidoreductase family membrane subunit
MMDATERRILEPLTTFGRGFYLTVTVLVLLVLLGGYAYAAQLREGLGVTGLNRPVFWGFYMTNFVFFIGISHAGTLISAILRASKAEWRRPVTRAAEAITVFALFLGFPQVLLDMGRIDRIWEVFAYGRFQSPILWDVVCISTYLFASITYLYVPMIPDIAIMRDRLPVGAARKWLYTKLAWGWTGTDRQRRRLDRAIAVLMVVVIPIAISVHTVVSWIFGMTVQPMWHSAIFGPYFVMGAIFSGIAAILVAMAILRKVYRLEPFLKPLHFNNLGLLLLVFNCLWFYFTFAEYLTTFYGNEPSHMAVFVSKTSQEFAVPFWTMVGVMVASFWLLALPTRRTVWGTTLASLCVLVGMWLERFCIVVPTLTRPRVAYPLGSYSPSWVEWSLFVGSLALLTLLYVLFSKLFPVVSIWEVKESPEGAAEVLRRLDTYHADGLEGPAKVAAATGTDNR